MRTDGQLLGRYLAGSESAFEELYRRHDRRVWAAALAVTADRASAEEVVQAVFFETARAARRLRGHADLGAYLARAARSRALDLARRRRAAARAVQSRGRESRSLLAAPPDAPAELAEEAARASMALAELAAEEREAVALRIYEGMTFEKIAAHAGAPLSTVHSRYRTAIEKLAQKLGVPDAGR